MKRTGLVYHFTDTINLPWILASGELRPCRITDTGIGETCLLWGTTNPLGDYTSKAQIAIHSDQGGQYFRKGFFHLVRFTMAADEFVTWKETIAASGWTAEQVTALVEDDRRKYGEFGHDRWRLRRDPLPLSRVLKVETTSYDDAETGQWHALDINKRGVLLRPRDPKRKGVKIGRKSFYSAPVRPDWQYYEPWPGFHRMYETREDYLADARYA